jgi:hypothetical protein
MRNKVGLYIREASEKRRYLKPHTKNSYAVVDNKPVFIAGGVYHLRYNNRWERLRGDYKAAQLLQRMREAEILTGALAPQVAAAPAEQGSALSTTIQKYLQNVQNTSRTPPSAATATLWASSRNPARSR